MVLETTTIMAARVTLLILVTGLFAAAWSSDQEPLAAVESKPPVRLHQYEPVLETALHRWKAPRIDQTADQRTEWTPTIGQRLIEEHPAGFPAGTYLVIDEHGRTVRVAIPAVPGNSELAATEIGDHFVTERDGERRHWIRLAESVPVAAEPAKSRNR
jgi:hypothetical protein